MQNTSEDNLTDHRKEHTLRTIEAIGILKDAFKQVDDMQIRLNDRDLQIQSLNIKVNEMELKNLLYIKTIEDLRKRPVWVGSHLSN